jgi:hypothetical protein
VPIPTCLFPFHCFVCYLLPCILSCYRSSPFASLLFTFLIHLLSRCRYSYKYIYIYFLWTYVYVSISSLIIKRQNFRLFFYPSIHLVRLSLTTERWRVFSILTHIYNPCLYRNPNLNRNSSFPHRICLYFLIYNLYSRSHYPSLLQFESDNNSTYGAINSLMWTCNSFLMSSPNLTRVISLPHDALIRQISL